MAELIYTVLMSLDGYFEDQSGNFDWAAPDAEVHGFINELARDEGTYLMGRKMYEVMVAWEDFPQIDQEPAVIQEYADIWKLTDKVVYSSTLGEVSSARTRLERHFDPATVRELKQRAESDISIGGGELAGAAIRAGLMDEIRLFVAPVVVGGGKYFLPKDVQLDLELLDQRRFEGGMVYLHYRVVKNGFEPG